MPSVRDEKEKLPKNPLNSIAISLSGGGFRATAFHLGLLSYLSTKNYNTTTLLERTRILSTVSAGTFVGVKYITTIKKGGTMQHCYNDVYNIMISCDMVSESLKRLSDDEHWKNQRQRSLINAFADLYYERFESELFGILWNESTPIHVKEIIFNATEFNFGLPFRFQKSEQITQEFIGNNKIHIPIEVAKEIRLADIIAASSCFPFGFEPINFPDDFIHANTDKLKDFTLLPQNVSDGDEIHYPIGLMDGAIDDNQGVGGILIGEEKMRRYPKELQHFRSDDDKAVDLYIISDASTPKMDRFNRTLNEKIKFVGNWTFESVKYFGTVSALMGASSIFYAFFAEYKTSIIALTIFGSFGLLIAVILLIISLVMTGLARQMGIPEFAVKRLLHFNRLKLSTLYNLMVNRKKSTMALVSDVLLKHMRWFSYDRVYGDPKWRTRLIMNAIFEFMPDEVKKRKIKYPNMNKEILKPGKKIVETTIKANKMGTRLWFVRDELKQHNNLPDTLIACGQYTTCFSILEYIEKIIKRDKHADSFNKYSDEQKEKLYQLEKELLDDWRKFKENPYWMVQEWNEQRLKSQAL